MRAAWLRAANGHAAHPALPGLALFTLLLFPGVVFRGDVLYERDIHLVWYAQVEAFVRSLAAGSWPLWNPYVSFGHPLLANANAQVLYPPAWINVLLRPPTAYAVLVLGHLAFGAFGLHGYARRLGLSRAAAFVAAASWLASGPLLSFVNVWHHLAAACWLPWILWGAESTLDEGSLRKALLWGAALGMQVLAGSPDVTMFTILILVAYVLTRWAGEPRPSAPVVRRVLIAASVAPALALGLSAAQWLPSLRAAGRSARQALPQGQQVGWSLHPAALLEAFLPGAFTDLPLQPWVRDLIFDGGRPFVHSLFVGGAVLVLAAAGLCGRGRPRRVFFAGVFLVSVLFALGRHAGLHALLVAVMPPLAMLRYPSKAIVVSALAAALLAGMGLDAWRKADEIPRRRWVAGVVVPAWVLAALTTAMAVVVRFRTDLLEGLLLGPALLGVPWVQTMAVPGEQLLVGALLATTLAILVTGNWRWSWRVAAGLSLAGLWFANRGVNPVAPSDFYRYLPPMLEAVTATDHSRMFVYRYTFAADPQHAGVDFRDPYRIATLPSTFSVYAGRALAARLYLMPPVGGSWGLEGSYEPDLLGLYPHGLGLWTTEMARAEGTPAYRRFLQMGAVDRVVALHTQNLENLVPVAEFQSGLALPIRVFRVPDPLPRAYAVGRTRIADDARAMEIVRDPAFDPRLEGLVSEGPALSGPDAPFSADVRIVEMRPDRVSIDARLDSPGLVVLVDTFDPGWLALLDGVPVPIRRVNVAFRGVDVPAGRHRIEYRYRPRAVVFGLWFSALSVGVLAVALVAGRRP